MIVHGDISVNGLCVNSSYMQHHTGYMHQEDIFIGTMTVMEHLWFMARMKLDRRMKNYEIRDRIDNLLRQVGLFHRTSVTIGSGGGDDKVLSGGEKKRLAFITEVIFSLLNLILNSAMIVIRLIFVYLFFENYFSY